MYLFFYKPSRMRNAASLSRTILLAVLLCGATEASTVSSAHEPCKSAVITSAASADDAYTARIRKLTCNAGEDTIYELEIEAKAKQGHSAWVRVVKVENDMRFPDAPSLAWLDSEHLDVTIKSRTLTGFLTEHLGYNLVLKRVYMPAAPTAFPNFF